MSEVHIERFGFTEIKEQGSKPVVIIVLVHGLMGNPQTTWTAKVPKVKASKPKGRQEKTSNAAGTAGTSSKEKKTFFSITRTFFSWRNHSRKTLPPTESPVPANSSEAVTAVPGSTSDHQDDPSSDLPSDPSPTSPSSAPLHPTARPSVEDTATDPSQAATASLKTKSSFCWPVDDLPKKIPNARILLYGYSADVISPFQAVGKASITSHGKDFLVALARRLPKDVPIIFVAHSLGGILVKDILCMAKRSRDLNYVRIPEQTFCTIFMGTPHRGAALGGMAAILGEITKLALQSPDTRILRGLDEGSEVLDRIHDEFVNQLLVKPDFKVHCFQEDRGVLGIKGLSQQVVNFQSSKIGTFDEKCETLTADHMNMVSYSSARDPNYIKVSDTLVDYVRQITEAAAPAPRELAPMPKIGGWRTVRTVTYDLLHKEPYKVVDEIFTQLPMQRGLDKTSDRWLEGAYTFKYPSQSNPLATIYVHIDWNRFEDPPVPICEWTIEAPQSLYFPGRHSGRILFRLRQGTLPDSHAFSIQWLTPILLPYLSPFGDLSSDGTFEDLSYFDGFAKGLEGLAHFLVYGMDLSKQKNIPPPPISWGVLDPSAYALGTPEFLRAASFFARAYTQPLPEEHPSTRDSHLPRNATAASVMAIKELLQRYQPEIQPQEWKYEEAYDGVSTQKEWAMEDQKWADRIIKACSQLAFLRYSRFELGRQANR